MTKFVSNLNLPEYTIYLERYLEYILKLNVITKNMYVGQIVLISTISIS